MARAWRFERVFERRHGARAPSSAATSQTDAKCANNQRRRRRAHAAQEQRACDGARSTHRHVVAAGKLWRQAAGDRVVCGREAAQRAHVADVGRQRARQVVAVVVVASRFGGRHSRGVRARWRGKVFVCD